MINILYAMNGVFHKGGTEAVILSYYNNLDKSEFHIDFLLHGHEEDNYNNEIHKKLINNGSKIFIVTPRGENPFRNRKEIALIFQRTRYDIVHSHMDAAGVFVLRQAKRAGVKVCISHSHNTAGKIVRGGCIKSFLYKIILEHARKEVSKYSDVRIACSTEAGEWLFGASSYVVVKNAIDIDRFKFDSAIRNAYRQELGLESSYVIGHVGRFMPQKNHMFLIDIFNEVHKCMPKSSLVLVGDGDLKQKVRERVQKYGLDGDVLFLGLRDDVNKIMQAMDIFLLPSLHEGLPVVGVEAQAAGLPCLISQNVSQQLKISENLYFESLSNPASKWAARVLELKGSNYDRSLGAEVVGKAGFGVMSSANAIRDIYTNCAK